MHHEPAWPREAQTTEGFSMTKRQTIQSGYPFLWQKSLTEYLTEQRSRKAWKKSSQGGKQTRGLVVKVSERLWKMAGDVTLRKHVTCVTWAGERVFISSPSCTHPAGVHCTPLLPPPTTYCCCHVPAGGPAAPPLALHPPQCTLLCISGFLPYFFFGCFHAADQLPFSQHVPL